MSSPAIDELVKQAIELGAWKEKKDGAKTYYYNAKTKETCWDLTKQFTKDPVKEAIASGVWKEKKDGDKTYFYNAITKKTTWNLEKELGVGGGTAASSAATTPASATNSEDPVAAALSSGLWKEKKDPSGKTYYYNTKTKETCWDLAKQLGVSAASTPSAAGGGTGDPVADALASGLWKEKQDPKGKTYYYNTKTKETCWDLAKHLGVSNSATATPRVGDDDANDNNNNAASVVALQEEFAAKQRQEEEEAEKKRVEEELERQRKANEEAEEKRKKEDKEEELRKQLLAPKKKEEVWKPPPPPAFPPPPPQGRHPNSQVPIYDTSSRRHSTASSNSQNGIDPSKTGGWRNYSKTRWLEELERVMGTALSPTRDQASSAAFAEASALQLQRQQQQDSSTSPMMQQDGKRMSRASSPARSAALEMAAITGVISAQETLQELTARTVDQKGSHQQQNTFVDFRDGACQTVFGNPTADVGVATLHAASNIAELIPIPDAGLMSCSTLESLKKEQERALVLLQHVQGTLASQMQEAGVAFTGHGSTRQLRLNIAKPKTGRNKTDSAEAADLAKELAPAYRSLQAPPSGPYWRFVTEHGSNSLYDEASTKRAQVVQNLTSGTSQRHELFDRISNELRDQYVLREKMWGEYTRVNANSFVDVADFVLKTENDIRNQRLKEDAMMAEARAANKAANFDEY